ncbi:MAG: carbohydrate kinase family protein [Trueperaceae bacterium]
MIVVAGHLCLDVIPAIGHEAVLEPGALVEVGSASFATGGAVANVGLSLARLGLEPTLVGRIGDDPFGEILRELLTNVSGGASGRSTPQPTLAIGAAVGESTSYTIVISPRNRDRTFLHHPGCNDTASVSDFRLERWSDARILHFGYPPLMRGVYEDGGEALATAFESLRKRGVTISLDMAMPDPSGPSGRVDWTSFLGRVLPHVDLFLPSWDETCFMLEPGVPRSAPTAKRLALFAERFVEAGAAVVGLKLGEDGLYLRTADLGRIECAGRAAPPSSWAQRELLSPNYKVEARGTTGAGDATIAGLLASLAHRLPIEKAAGMAAAAGACSVEGVDASGGVRSWRETMSRVSGGWQREQSRVVGEPGTQPDDGLIAPTRIVGQTGDQEDGRLSAPTRAADLGDGDQGWLLEPRTGVWMGPHDQGGGE